MANMRAEKIIDKAVKELAKFHITAFYNEPYREGRRMLLADDGKCHTHSVRVVIENYPSEGIVLLCAERATTTDAFRYNLRWVDEKDKMVNYHAMARSVARSYRRLLAEEAEGK